MLTPLPGERVIEVPQAYSHLMSDGRGSMVGLPVGAIERLVSPRYGSLRWTAFDPKHHPAWGYGLLVVRDGVLQPGPARWDTSD
jgi:hypothetical protein